MHKGHRGRLVNKVRSGGIIYEHELMEILLYNACPRKDVNDTAHALIERFHSVGAVLEADCSDLANTDGVGANMAEYLAVVGKAMRAVRNADGFAVVRNVREFKRYIFTRPAPKNDCLELYCLGKDGGVRRVISFKGETGLRAAPEEAEILKLVSTHRPYGIFAAGRRAEGNRPADALDDELHERIYRISLLCGARLYDYCLVGGDGGFYSYKMSDRGVFADKGKGELYGE